MSRISPVSKAGSSSDSTRSLIFIFGSIERCERDIFYKAKYNDRFKNKANFKFLMAKKGFLSHNAMDKIMREAGASRVSDDAKVALAELLQRKALDISTEAKKFAEHAGRKTITEKDIRLALK